MLKKMHTGVQNRTLKNRDPQKAGTAALDSTDFKQNSGHLKSPKSPLYQHFSGNARILHPCVKSYRVARSMLSHNGDGTKHAGISLFGGIGGAGWNHTHVSTEVDFARLIDFPAGVASVMASVSGDRKIVVRQTFRPEGARNPVKANEIQRWVWSHGAQSGWHRVANPYGKMPVFTDNDIGDNEGYRYRAHTWNERGETGWVYSDWVYTKPGAPVGVSAVKLADRSIRVTWRSGAVYRVDRFDIYDGALKVGSVSGDTLSFTHSGASSFDVHRYTVKAVYRTFVSDASGVSNTVQLLTAPQAPSIVSGSGVMLPAGRAPVLVWRHNPVDTTAQRQARVRIRRVGDTEWTTLSAASSERLEATGVTVAGRYEWQVQTRGEAESFSPWSQTASFQLVSLPSVTLTAPTAGVYARSVLDVAWRWSQSENVPQSRWSVRVVDAAGAQVASGEGTGSVSSWQAPVRLKDKTTYRVVVEVFAGDYISARAEREFTTGFPLPAAPRLSLTWWDSGYVFILVTAGSGGGVDTVRMEIERSVDGGRTWEKVDDTADSSATFIDSQALSYGVTKYRATAWSDLPSSAETISEIETSSEAIFLGGGANYDDIVPLVLNGQPAMKFGRERSMFSYAGRTLPVGYAGEHVTREVTVSAAFVTPAYRGDRGTLPVSSFDAIQKIAQNPWALHLYRDPYGTRLYGVLSDVQISKMSRGVYAIKFTITEADR